MGKLCPSDKKILKMSRDWNNNVTKDKYKLKNKRKNKDFKVYRTEFKIKKLLEITYIRTYDKIARHLTMYEKQ